MEIDLQVQQGWQCPVCKRVYSPTTVMCLYCGNTKYNTTTDIESVKFANIEKYINDDRYDPYIK